MDQQFFSQKKKEKWLKLNSKCTKSPGMELPHWMKRFLIIKCDSPKPGLLYREKSDTFLLPGFYLCVDLVKELADNFLDFCHCIF